MMLPAYWLTRPEIYSDEKIIHAFDALLNSTLKLKDCPTIDFNLPQPKWQFLCYIAEHHNITLHGSGDSSINLFEPRQSNDLNEFGNQKAIYAAADGIWSMFFAIVDRERVETITNACIRLTDELGVGYGPYYFFFCLQTRFTNSTLAKWHSLSFTKTNLHHSVTSCIWFKSSSHCTISKF